jgi:CubicO group peptidase (beta-lactamase class C family)
MAFAHSKDCAAPVDRRDGWPVSRPEALDLDPRELCAVVGWLDGLADSNVHSVLIARHGVLVFEHYRRGADSRWGTRLPDVTHGPETKHDLRSVTKSVTGLLTGIAVARQLIPNISVPVFEYFPEYADLRTPDKDRIQLHHLLTMSAGLEWDENVPVTDPNHGEMRMWRSNDPLRVALEPRVAAAPGLDWNYSGGCTELLGAILQKSASVAIDQFARDTLFGPLGIEEVEWAQHADGRPSASGGLRMRPRDIAKIGQLVIGRGSWNGCEVLPAQWIDDSIAPQIGAADRLYFYGYQWWLGRSLIGRKELTWASAVGLGGQRMYVVPSLGLVVVVTAGHYSDGMQAWLPLVILNRYVLPSVRERPRWPYVGGDAGSAEGLRAGSVS